MDLSRLTVPSLLGFGVRSGASLVPLVGVVLWGWGAFDLVVLYWLEIGAIVGLSLPLVAVFESASGTDGDTDDGPVSGVAGRVLAVCLPGAVLAMFWGGHGILLMAIANTLFAGLDQSDVWVSAGTVEPALAATVASYLLAVVTDLLGYSNVPGSHARSSLGRVVGDVMFFHTALIVGVFVVIALGSPLWLLVVIVVLKAALDVVRPLVRGDSRSDDAPDGATRQPS